MGILWTTESGEKLFDVEDVCVLMGELFWRKELTSMQEQMVFVGMDLHSVRITMILPEKHYISQ